MSRACDRCGVMLGESDLRFVIEIQVTADVAPVLDLDISDDAWKQALQEVLEQAARTPKPELEAEVHQRLAFLVCPRCRLKFVADPLGSGRPGGGVGRRGSIKSLARGRF